MTARSALPTCRPCPTCSPPRSSTAPSNAFTPYPITVCACVSTRTRTSRPSCGTWGKGGREKKIQPLLESLTRVPATNGVTLAVGYLLPPFARLRLNTFPDAWTEPQVAKEDCFWTSLNFFNDKPDMRYLDAAYVKQTLRTQYDVLAGQPAYGDLVALLNEAGDGLHLCVYIADDFVFTKNGVNRLQPWVMMKIPDMLLAFPSEKPQRLAIFRRREG